MNHRKRIGKLMLAGLAASLTLSITQVQGSTLDTLTQEEKQTEAQIASVEVTIGETLASINLKQMGIDDLKAQIVATEESQIETKAAIEAQKEVIASRKEQLKTRLVALQTSDATKNQVLMLLDSENFADFINRAYVVGQLQAADNEQIESAISEEEKLTALEEQLADANPNSQGCRKPSEIRIHCVGGRIDFFEGHPIRQPNRVVASENGVCG